MSKVNAEREIDTLWQAFQNYHDPTIPTIQEEVYDQILFEDTLTSKKRV